MKILFIMPLDYSVYPFQIGALSAFLKKHKHKTDYLELILGREFNQDDALLVARKIESFQPHLIGFSSYEMSFEWIKDIAGFIKAEYNLPIIVGGYHATLVPEEVINHSSIDMVCRGEGEYALLELLEGMEQDRETVAIKNIWFKRNGKIIRNGMRPLIEDLDRLPFLDRNSFNYQEQLNRYGPKRYLGMMGSRGCPFNCSYCSNHAFRMLYPNKERYFRWRSVDHVLNEIEECRREFLFGGISFEDDIFTGIGGWLEEFCEKYPKRFALPFRCNARPETATFERMTMLKEAGCESVSFGIESGDERIRKEVLRRDISNSQIREAFRNAKRAGLKVRSYSMVGLPHETRSSLLRTILLNFKVAPHEVQTTVFYPFQGTSLGKLCYEKNWVDWERKKEAKIYANDSILNLPTISRREIQIAKWINSATALRSGNLKIAKAGIGLIISRLKTVLRRKKVGGWKENDSYKVEKKRLMLMKSTNKFSEFNVQKFTKPINYSSSDFRLKEVLDLIGTGKKVLDIGCYDGTVTKLIKDKGNDVTGLEISDEAIVLAKVKDLQIIKADLSQEFPVPDNAFDVVFAGEVIEHIFDTDGFLQEISRVLKNNGHLVLTTPNLATFGRRLLLLFGKNPLIENSIRDKNSSGHIRYFTKGSLSELLCSNGFKIDKLVSNVVNFNLSGTLRSRLLAKLFPTLGSILILKASKRF